jgi:hypothetical protein
VFANAEYNDGEFQLTLPANVDSQYLEPLDDIPASITVSNRNVKNVWVYELHTYKASDNTGSLYF